MTGHTTPTLAPLGDSAILITLGNAVDIETNREVHARARAIESANIDGMVEVVPAYASLAVHYDGGVVEAAAIIAQLRRIVSGEIDTSFRLEAREIVTIPVRYDGVDLHAVADATGLSTANVIARHSAGEYAVYMMGFTPGFAYLGDLDPALCLPRRDTPRPRVPRGSVAIAGTQTAVYPHETPGGWHLIGSTELPLFDPRRDPPSLLRAGDRVRFERVA